MNELGKSMAVAASGMTAQTARLRVAAGTAGPSGDGAASSPCGAISINRGATVNAKACARATAGSIATPSSCLGTT